MLIFAVVLLLLGLFADRADEVIARLAVELYEKNGSYWYTGGVNGVAMIGRIGWGLVYQVHELTDDKKIQAMRTHAADCGFELSHDICRYLLRHGRRDLPSLLMTLEALDRYSLVHQRPVTIPLLRELLQVAT